MTKPKFSHWVHWEDRDMIDSIKNPGVYALAITTKDISKKPFDYIKEIVYFGMTNSAGGLKARLNQFDYTIAQKKRSVHGGAERVLYKHRDYSTLIRKLFVSVCPIECEVLSNSPKDLLKMGEVAWFEYYCFSEYVERFEKLPEFNDKKNSPKLK